MHCAQRYFIAAVAGFFFSLQASPQTDKLTPEVSRRLTEQCGGEAGYQSCVSALRYHGQGKDDLAMEVLLASAKDDKTRELFTIAHAKPKGGKDGFWKLAAIAGALPTGCGANLVDDTVPGLPNTLKVHFDYSARALSDAADDSARNSFLGLSDLLAVPPGVSLKVWIPYATVYRACFYDPDALFAAVGKAVGR